MDLECLTKIKEVMKDYTIGKGKYNSKKDLRAYQCWNAMMRRCYLDYQCWNAYKDVTVCDQWHSFQAFAEFYYTHHYDLPNGERVEIDKDILQHGRKIKIYSPETCLFVPHTLNAILINKHYNNGLPVGVSFYDGKYHAEINMRGKRVKKAFDDPMQAFKFYKKIKEKYIKSLADQYREWIPDRVYQAMVCWTVEIGD